MKTIKELKARVQPGTKLLCVANTLHAEVDGKVRTVKKAGTKVVKCEQDGREWHMEWRSGIVIVDEDTFRMPLGVEDHTVTLRFVGQVSA